MTKRITHLRDLSANNRPKYDPNACGTGIVHLGVGSFHKAHQAYYTDKVLEKSGGDWRIIGVSLRSNNAQNELRPQKGLYTLLMKGQSGTTSRVIGSIYDVLSVSKNSEPAIHAMVSKNIKIVSLTVTEKAYGLDLTNFSCNTNHPDVAYDLKNFHSPRGVLGILTKALEFCKYRGLSPFSILCCDNLPNNGKLLRSAILDFSQYIDKKLCRWIEDKVSFPSTMVDRITPSPTQKTYQEAKKIIHLKDHAAVETEDFSQWIIEDNFPLGRPNWDSVGAIFTNDVGPFEKMKLRMLNGTHSMLAYTGFHSGHKYVRDVMNDKVLYSLVERHILTAAQTLKPIKGIDYLNYGKSLISRFLNPEIAHETFQIAMDGTEKMQQRIFYPLKDAISLNLDTRPFAFATAAWLRHVSKSYHDCPPYELRDPLAQKLNAFPKDKTAYSIISYLSRIGLLTDGLEDAEIFWGQVSSILNNMMSKPMKQVVEEELV